MKKQLSFKWTEPIIAVCTILFIPLSAVGLCGTYQLEKDRIGTKSELSSVQSSLASAKLELANLKAFAAWGPGAATIDTKVLEAYKDAYKAMLIFRADVRSVDYLTDEQIAKSYLFEIDGLREVEVPLEPSFWSRMPSSTGMIHVYLVVLPKDISSERISSLKDVELNKGHIVAKRGVKATLLLHVTRSKSSDADKEKIPATP